MKLKGIFTALLAAALVCLLPVTALADAETQPALLLSASQTLVERYNTFTVDVFLTGTPGADILPAAETHIDCDNASVEATSAGTAANSKITADGTAVTLSYYGEESAVFAEGGEERHSDRDGFPLRRHGRRPDGCGYSGSLRFLRRVQRDHLSLFLFCGRGAGGVAQDRGYGRAGLLRHVRRQRRGDGGSVAAQARKARITSHKRVKQRGQTPSLLLPIRNRAASADIGCIEP